VRLLVRLIWWLVRRLAMVVVGLLHLLVELRAESGPAVLVHVANRRRAVLIRRTVRQAARAQIRALDFDPPEGLVIVVAETVDSLGERPSLVEREDRPDGTTRYLLQLALAVPGRRSPPTVDTLITELWRQLVRLQRELDATRVVMLPEDGDGGPFLGTPSTSLRTDPPNGRHHGPLARVAEVA
jgi:hypothetical protein